MAPRNKELQFARYSSSQLINYGVVAITKREGDSCVKRGG